MPLIQYFAWVGSALLALLFIVGACLPEPPAAGDSDVQLPVIRIHSDQKKLPERIDYDTAALLPKPSADAQIITSTSPAGAIVSPKVRGALAELQTSGAGSRVNAKEPEARPQRLHRFAKKHATGPVLLARRSPFGWFGPRIW